MRRVLVLAGAALVGVCGAAGAQAQTVPGGGRLVFADEFSGTALDTTKWKVGDQWNNRSLSGNGEQQFYAGQQGDPCSPLSVGLGALSIAAKPADQTACAGVTGGQTYVSGEISTSGKFKFRYGYVEMRARLPDGVGMWPAFWLLPDNGQWPPEIDIVEKVDNDPAVVQTTHWSGGMDATKYDGIKPSEGMHTYAVDWEPGGVTYYVDGVLTATKSNVSNQDMYILVNLAVGGYWPGNPGGESADMVVDYVRVYSTDTNLPAVASAPSPVDWQNAGPTGITAAAQTTETPTPSASVGSSTGTSGDASGSGAPVEAAAVPDAAANAASPSAVTTPPIAQGPKTAVVADPVPARSSRTQGVTASTAPSASAPASTATSATSPAASDPQLDAVRQWVLANRDLVEGWLGLRVAH